MNRNIVITGASRGIGLATATRLADLGARLALVARNQDALDRAASTLTGEPAITVAGDVADPETWRRIAAATATTWSGVDGLFLNAGTAPFLPVEAVDVPAFDACFHPNVLASLLAVRALLPQLRRDASILLTGSGMHARPLSNAALWVASTHAAVGLAKALA